MKSHNHYLYSLIEQGEHEHLDFKYQISDAKKIARSIAAFANNDGGRLLVGVKDNGSIVGISSDEEIYMIEQAAEMYCKPEQKVECRVLRAEGKSVLEVIILPTEDRPVKALDENNQWRAYYRVADENVLASNLHVKLWKSQKSPNGVVTTITSQEQEVLSYLNTHGAITVKGVATLVHISLSSAEQMIVNLAQMGVVNISYHKGECLICL